VAEFLDDEAPQYDSRDHDSLQRFLHLAAGPAPGPRPAFFGRRRIFDFCLLIKIGLNMEIKQSNKGRIYIMLRASNRWF